MSVKAKVDNKRAVMLADEIFNVIVDDPSTVKEFASYDDRNFYLCGTRDGVVGEFVLKISNSGDTENLGVIEGTNAVMMYLNKKGIPCCFPQPTRSGDMFEIRQFTDEDDHKSSKRGRRKAHNHAVRLFNFLPGKTMKEVGEINSNDLFYEVGCYVAKIDHALKDFESSGMEDRHYHWDLQNFEECTKLAKNIKDQNQKRIVESLKKLYRTYVEPKLGSLPKQFIHNDINEGNLLVRNIQDSTTDYEICGVIDFSDVVYSCRVCDIAIAACYMATMAEGDVVEAAAYTVAGFQQHFSLTHIENNLLFYLLQLRLCQNICYGVSNALDDPENAEYLLHSTKSAGKVFDAFEKITLKEFNDLWQKIMKSKQIESTV